jgi:regulator of sirC expression with transglutaminase-like and TPR domain
MRDPEIDPEGYMEDQKTLQNWLSEDTSFRKEAITNYLDQVTDIEKAHREKTITESLLLTVEGKPIDEPTGVEL